MNNKGTILFENNDLKIECFEEKRLYFLNVILKKPIISSEVLKQLSVNTLKDSFYLKDKGVILNGKLPVWLYSRLTTLLKGINPLFLAVNDPSQSGAIVVDSNSNEFKLGEKIAKEEFITIIEKQEQNLPAKKIEEKRDKKKVIALVGPPHSGKSVFLYAICKAIAERDINYFQKNVFIIRACPDGEGDWFLRNFNESNIYRIKFSFDDKFVKNVIERIKNTSENKKIIFVDCGGKIDINNKQIWEHCSHCIIISSDYKQVPYWIGATSLCNLKLLAIVKSKNYIINKVTKKDNDNVLNITLGKLDRKNSENIKIKDLVLERILNF